jgi:hypothetical protein
VTVGIDLRAALTAVMDDQRAGLAVGTFGALAEFVRPPDASVAGRHDDGRLEAVTDGGAVRVAVVDGLSARAWRRPTGTGTSWSHAVALCLPAARAAGPGRSVVTVLGPDDDALVPAAPGAALVDLGLGVDHLEACVRTDDPALLERLRDAEGGPLDADLSAALVAAGPTRVFRTVAARIEVTTPIPPPTAASPAGPHTHLLPALLAHRRTHAATDPIPDGHVPVAMLFPAHPQHDPLGRPHDAFDAAADAAFDQLMATFGEPDEVEAARYVRDGITRGAAAASPSASLTRAGRRGWEVELRRWEASGRTTATWAAWRAASSVSDPGVPFHEAHG